MSPAQKAAALYALESYYLDLVEDARRVCVRLTYIPDDIGEQIDRFKREARVCNRKARYQHAREFGHGEAAACRIAAGTCAVDSYELGSAVQS